MKILLLTILVFTFDRSLCQAPPQDSQVTDKHLSWGTEFPLNGRIEFRSPNSITKLPLKKTLRFYKNNFNIAKVKLADGFELGKSVKISFYEIDTLVTTSNVPGFWNCLFKFESNLTDAKFISSGFRRVVGNNVHYIIATSLDSEKKIYVNELSFIETPTSLLFLHLQYPANKIMWFESLLDLISKVH